MDKPRYTSVFAVGDQVFYPWGGLVAFRAAGEFDLNYQGMLNQGGLLATREAHRKALKLGEMDDREALKMFQDKVTKRGTLACTNAAMADGMAVVPTTTRNCASSGTPANASTNETTIPLSPFPCSQKPRRETPNAIHAIQYL